MKRKTIYAALLVFFAALISSANTTSSKCTLNALSYSKEKNCCAEAKAAEKAVADSPAMPNLLLFDL